jgi:hypothetical protein
MRLKSIALKINQFFDEFREFGLYISITSLFWPIICNSRFQSLSRLIMAKKHAMVMKILSIKSEEIIKKYNAASIITEYDENAPIWVCWLQGEDLLPIIPKMCIETIKKNSNGHPVNLLTFDNFKDYVLIPEYILSRYEQGYIKNANFVDIIRTTLLAEHGGCWIDSTILLTDVINEDIFIRPFYSIKRFQSGLYITENLWSNFFLASHRHSILFSFVRDVFYEYFKTESRFIDYFMMDYLIRIGYNSIHQIREIIDDCPFNNKNIHKLAPLLFEKYQPDVFQDLQADTYVFKLSWRMNADNVNIDSYLSKIFSHA